MFSQNDAEQAIWLEYFGDRNGNRVPDPEEIGIHYFKGDGDFRSQECIELLKEADIVVTNPPFSLFREYVAQLMKYEKKFVILGNQNALTYKEIFSLVRNNLMWLGSSLSFAKFRVPNYYEERSTRFWVDETGQKWRSFGNICWFTNLDIAKRHEDIILYKAYSPEEYPKYDNYDAINVNKTSEIPMEYDGIMGVPITFLDKYNPSQFEIIGLSASAGYDEKIVGIPFIGEKDARASVEGKTCYARVLIRRKQKPIEYASIAPSVSMAAETQAPLGRQDIKQAT